MSRSRPDPRRRTTFSKTSWQSIATRYGLVLAGFALFVGLSYPLASVLVVAIVGVALLAVPRVIWLVQCARNCRALTVDLAGIVRVTVTGTGESRDLESPTRC